VFDNKYIIKLYIQQQAANNFPAIYALHPTWWQSEQKKKEKQFEQYTYTRRIGSFHSYPLAIDSRGQISLWGIKENNSII